ncbi:hypothetical protein [Pengzhenrongella sicca]|uniref:Uncharacterized protein n=1 Tax=Pengzhenrongella sicca TaxID=2819238 RepID=A0A8A4ZMW1_9MICO|nr:hypothetical protein [Pengzhenrongella sicca]QTE30898.1 hypothetical protein J4E96_08220 [Pengzhenrongella sicca]
MTAAPTGPSVAALMQRLAGGSPDLLDPGVNAVALVADTLVDTCGVVLDRPTRALVRTDVDATDDARAAAALTCWLALAPGLRAAWSAGPAGQGAGAAERVLAAVRALVTELAPSVPPRRWIEDPAGREEAARAFLRAAGLLPAGESAAIAQDRWSAISTAARRDAEREIAQEARRTQELARRLAEQRAKEAVAQYTYV